MTRRVDPYLEIERRTGFRVPDLYRRMRADGACDYGRSRKEWLATWRERALENPPALLGVPDFEWMSLGDMLSWSPPEHWLSEHRFVPFGETSAGDRYAWYPAWSEGEDVPVVLALHDENRCECLAPHLEGFLYRELLEALTFMSPDDDEDEGDGLTPEETRQAMRASVKVLRPYLRPAWIADLEALVAREPKEWSRKLRRSAETFVSQLDEGELEERLSRELGFSRLNTAFQHMKP